MPVCSGVPVNKHKVYPSTTAEAYLHCATQMLRLALSKPAQVILLSALPVEIASTFLHAGPFASQAPRAVTSKQEATMSIKRSTMFISQEDLEEVFGLQKFALQPAQRQTLVLPHPGSQQRAAAELTVSAQNFSLDAAWSPNDY